MPKEATGSKQIRIRKDEIRLLRTEYCMIGRESVMRFLELKHWGVLRIDQTGVWMWLIDGDSTQAGTLHTVIFYGKGKEEKE